MKKQFLLLFMLTGLLTSCIQDNFDNPPTNGVDPDITPTITIADLKAMYTGTAIQLDDSLVIMGIVVADDKSGNFYKSIVIQDSTAGILIRMDNTGLFGSYPVGRKLFIKLGGLWMGDYGGLIQLGGANTVGTTDGVDPIPAVLFDQYILKGTLNNTVDPIDVDITSLNNSHQNMLIRLSGVQFIPDDTAETFADAILQQTVNLYIKDCNDNQIIVRTSGYADFAGTVVPSGNGEFVCIYSIYNSDQQLIIRNPSDLKMNDPRCGDPLILKDFEDGSALSGGWINYNVTGSINWTTNTMGAVYGSVYGQCSNYIPPNQACETWLISPSMDLTGASSNILTFYNACNYSGANLQVYLLEDYISGNPNTGGVTQVLLPCTLSTGSWSWVSSGNIDLNAYMVVGTNARIGFKYTGSGSDGKTWEIDEIKVIPQ